MNVKKNPKNNVICTMSYEKKKKNFNLFFNFRKSREYMDHYTAYHKKQNGLCDLS